MGLHATRRAEERPPPRGPLDDSPDPEGVWLATGPAAADVVADVSPRHWGAIAGADFFTAEVWTWQGLVTDDTGFVIDLASRRVHVLGSTPHPTELFMGQVVRLVTAAEDGVLIGPACPDLRLGSEMEPCGAQRLSTAPGRVDDMGPVQKRRFGSHHDR